MNLHRKTRNLATSLQSWAARRPLLQKMVPELKGNSIPQSVYSISLDDFEPWPANEVEALLDRINPKDVGVIPKFCHHVPGYDHNWVRRELQAVLKILFPFHEKLYGDLTRPGIHVAGGGSWGYILEDHPEIDFFAWVYRDLKEKDLEDIRSIRGEAPLTTRDFSMEDWDPREAYRPYNNLYKPVDAPSEENVRPLVDFLKEWHAAGSPSFLLSLRHL